MKTILGSRATDKITGFSGIVTGRVEYITGCTQLLVQPRINDKQEVPEPRWFDDQRCDVDAADRIVLDNSTTPGCDIPAPIR